LLSKRDRQVHQRSWVTVGRLILSLVALLLGAAGDGLALEHEHPPSPWVEDLGYARPAPGSYRLPVLSPAADGTAVAAGGEPVSLQSLFAGKIALLSFIYTQCSDARGCPMATRVLHEVEVLDDGYLWRGQRYRSLSAIALAITGTKWSGPRFFGIKGG